MLLVAAAALVNASNIDPTDKYAWSENSGWLNANPIVSGSPGVTVEDFRLTGWIWGENIGWISLSCSNTASCQALGYGVVNDGVGHLSGFAWSENAGWINFGPGTAGVNIDRLTGDFSGYAWSENMGWIGFASSGAVPYKVRTTWSCPLGTPIPGTVRGLTLQRSIDSVTLTWGAVASATGYDGVRGDLAMLRTTGGDFTAATNACLVRKQAGTSAADDDRPPAGNGFWYLIRAASCAGTGTYDDGSPSQAGSRDAEIDASSAACH